MSPNHKDNKAMNRTFRVAFILFSTTLGIGLYALIGAPIKRLSTMPFFDNLGNTINSANVALINIFSDSNEFVNKEDIKIKLDDPSTDFFKIKKTFIETPFDNTAKKIVTLYNKDKELSISEFLYYISDIKPSDTLMRVMQGGRYYISYDKEYNGVVVVPVLEDDIAFASIMEWESKFVDYTLPLVKPLISSGDIKTYKELKVVTRNIEGVDSRVIIGSSDTILYLWSIYKKNVIVSSNVDDFKRVISVLNK